MLPRLLQRSRGTPRGHRRCKPGKRPARSPRSPATSPAQYPAGSGVGVSVLLRQPHGFEGLGRRRIGGHARDLAVLQRHRSASSCSKGAPLSLPRAVLPAQREHPSSPRSMNRSTSLRMSRGRRRYSRVAAAIASKPRHVPLHPGCRYRSANTRHRDRRSPEPKSPRAQCVVQPAHNLHVLLRHRLLRQPGGFEGLSPREESADAMT